MGQFNGGEAEWTGRAKGMCRHLGRSFALVLLAMSVACSSAGPDGAAGSSDAVARFTRLAAGTEVVSIHGLPDGRIRYAERAGTVWELDSADDETPTALVRLAVDTEDQRGLLGIASTSDGLLFASWVDTNGALLVSQVERGVASTVWTGPTTAPQANGGHLVLGPGGELIIGIGDLNQGQQRGRFLQLDPDGAPTQPPVVLSTGWNNPFAYDITPTGHIWVADNAPREEPERIGRGDTGAIIGALTIKTAPAGLAVLGDTDGVTTLAICGYVSRRLDIWRINDNAPKVLPGRPLADDCATAVAVLPDGRLAYATVDAVMVTTAPVGTRA